MPFNIFVVVVASNYFSFKLDYFTVCPINKFIFMHLYNSNTKTYFSQKDIHIFHSS